MGKLTLEIAAWSSIGPRAKNDDFSAFVQDENGTYLALSDGIGGAPYGEVFSKLACAESLTALAAKKNATEAIAYANEFCCRVRSAITDRGSGATLLLAAVSNDGSVDVGWVGDSLLFHIRGEKIAQINEPDRVAGANALASAIGMPETRIYTTSLSLESEDYLVLASDGVHEHLEPARILSLLKESQSIHHAAIDIAETAGSEGTDNSTVLIAHATQG